MLRVFTDFFAENEKPHGWMWGLHRETMHCRFQLQCIMVLFCLRIK